MGRHGYSSDLEPLSLGRWRAQIASATRGKRGQAFFRALIDALDAMPEKRLVADDLQKQDGSVCALGCLGKARGVDLRSVVTEDWDKLGELFDIAPQLAQEVMYINDELAHRDEDRWRIVRDWAAKQIRVAPDELASPPPRVGGE